MQPRLLGPPAPGVVQVDIDGRVAAYAPGSDQVVFLNETASQVWRLLDGTLDRAALLGRLCAAYGVEPEQIAPDVDAALESFVTAGLVDRDGAEA